MTYVFRLMFNLCERVLNSPNNIHTQTICFFMMKLSDYVIQNDSFVQVIRKDEFKQAIVSAFSHKVARSIISNNDGLFDKVSNELKQDAVFKSRMALAVANVVNECLLEREGS